jgi:hypothetical protein
MRSELVATALALAGCEYTDAERAIALHFDGISDAHRTAFVEAATCWNLQFGTKFTLDQAPQVVEIFYDDATCLTAVAQVQPGTPSRLGVCPERYWDAVLPHGGVYIAGVDAFRIFSHELGHVLNIIGHPNDPSAVMRSGGFEGVDMFRPSDIAMFADFNADHAIAPQCTHVLREHVPGTTTPHCACDDGTRLDPVRPIAVSFTPEVLPGEIDAIATALTCWNLRYGLDLRVRPPGPGDQRILMDHDTYTPFNDRGTFIAGGGGPYGGAMAQVARALDMYYPFHAPTQPFTAADDAAFARRYHQGVACRTIAVGSVGVCRCAPSPGEFPAE